MKFQAKFHRVFTTSLLIALMWLSMPMLLEVQASGLAQETPTPEPTTEPTDQPTPEVTETPTPEVSPEVTETPTPEITPEPTETPTPEVSPEVTETPTPEVTPEPTETSTPDVTPEPTETPTPDVTPEPDADGYEQPTSQPTDAPAVEPNDDSNVQPTYEPGPEVTDEPTPEVTDEPTVEPTDEPTTEPTVELTPEPTPESSAEPTTEPTTELTPEPTAELTPEPTDELTPEPTVEPAETPTPELDDSLDDQENPQGIANGVVGYVAYQGRPEHTGIEIVTVGFVDKNFQTDPLGQFEIIDLANGNYEVRADADLYLPSCAAVIISDDENVTLTAGILFGGDTDDSDAIKINDATLIGSNFGLSATSTPAMDPRADINADGQVNIKDLAILGGNGGREGCQVWEGDTLVDERPVDMPTS